ncbi:MAG: acyl-CoA thioesterase [Flavobacteriales bacterium]|jgi:acyl-CoA thioester hydrolase
MSERQYTPYRIDIRFADIDALGHVNNATYFTYFEQARIHFFRELIGREWNWDETGILVAHNEIDYLRPIVFRDEVLVYIGCSHVGSKSFTLTYTLVKETSQGEEVMAKGASVLVCVDHRSKSTRPIPDSWNAMLRELLTQAQ